MAGVGCELALTAKRRTLLDERLADRDEGATGVEGPEAERHEHDEEPSDQQDGPDRIERLDLREPVLDDLDVEDVAEG